MRMFLAFLFYEFLGIQNLFSAKMGRFLVNSRDSFLLDLPRTSKGRRPPHKKSQLSAVKGAEMDLFGVRPIWTDSWTGPSLSHMTPVKIVI